MINVTKLDVAAGGIGAMSDTSDLATQKTILASGVTGTVVLLASADGTVFLPVATITSGSAIVTFAAVYMQVDSSAGAASTVFVMAEQGAVCDAGGTVLAGPSAPIDATVFGPASTFYVVNSGGTGSIDVEIAGSDNVFVPFKSYPASTCVTENFSAFAIRSVGNGTTGNFAVASERPATRAMNSPTPTFVFRPGGARGGNVYTDWTALMAAIGSVGGRRILEFDDSAGLCQIPAGAWEMKDVVWAGCGPTKTSVRPSVSILEGAILSDFRMIGGNLQVKNQATITPPVSDFVAGMNMVHIGLRDDGGTSDIQNPGAAPLFELGTNSVFFFIQNSVFGVNPALPATHTPLIRHTGASVCSINLLGQNQTGPNLVQSTNGATVLFGALSSSAQIAADQSTITGGGKLQFGPLGRIQRSVLPLASAPSATAATMPPFNKPYVLLRCDGRAPGFAVQLPNIGTGFTVGNTAVPLYTGGQEVVIAEVEGGTDLTIHATGGDTIDGLPWDVWVPPHGSRTLISDGQDMWITLAEYGQPPRRPPPFPLSPLNPSHPLAE